MGNILDTINVILAFTLFIFYIIMIFEQKRGIVLVDFFTFSDGKLFKTFEYYYHVMMNSDEMNKDNCDKH